VDLVVKLAEHGLIHGDFNEFNLMVSEEEEVTIIDFPQMVSTNHVHATELFDRDVTCLQDFFAKKFNLSFESKPELKQDIGRVIDLDA
jgi:RIO kinase 2